MPGVRGPDGRPIPGVAGPVRVVDDDIAVVLDRQSAGVTPPSVGRPDRLPRRVVDDEVAVGLIHGDPTLVPPMPCVRCPTWSTGLVVEDEVAVELHPQVRVARPAI